MPFCHNCGTQLNETAKFCPSCGSAFQGAQLPSQQGIQSTAATIPIQPTESTQVNPPVAVQQNIVVMGKAKSVGTAFLLAFLFGPLGLLYASVVGGIVMFIVAIILGIAIPVIGFIISWIICIIWAVVEANNANANLNKQAGSITRAQSQTR